MVSRLLMRNGLCGARVRFKGRPISAEGQWGRAYVRYRARYKPQGSSQLGDRFVGAQLDSTARGCSRDGINWRSLTLSSSSSSSGLASIARALLFDQLTVHFSFFQ